MYFFFAGRHSRKIKIEPLPQMVHGPELVELWLLLVLPRPSQEGAGREPAAVAHRVVRAAVELVSGQGDLPVLDVRVLIGTGKVWAHNLSNDAPGAPPMLAVRVPVCCVIWRDC